MTKGGKGGKRVGRATAPRSLSKESRANQMWWWIGGAAAVLLVAAVALWFTVGPGKPAAPEPTPAPTEPVDVPSPTAPTAATIFPIRWKRVGPGTTNGSSCRWSAR